MTGTLIGIARRGARGSPMEEIATIAIHAGGGLDGDHKGLKFPKRGVTVLAREAWEATIADLKDMFDPPQLPWTTRRANLLVEGVRLPRARGGVVTIGPVKLEITGETSPCQVMERAHPGLLKALHREWRGGVTCRVLEGGQVSIGDRVDVLVNPPEVTPRLP
jgi:MOSC domain-containing protein YiiM